MKQSHPEPKFFIAMPNFFAMEPNVLKLENYMKEIKGSEINMLPAILLKRFKNRIHLIPNLSGNNEQDRKVELIFNSFHTDYLRHNPVVIDVIGEKVGYHKLKKVLDYDQPVFEFVPLAIAVN